MELPNQNAPLLFTQMLQMFPNIPHEIILLYSLQYSNDVEKCIQMLKMQNGKYMNAGENDLIVNFPADQQLSDLNIEPNQLTDSFGDETSFDKSYQLSNSPQLNALNNNVGTKSVMQSSMNNIVPTLEHNSNENISDDSSLYKELKPSVESPSVHPECSLPIPDNENSVQNPQRIFQNGVLNIPPYYLEASPALHINVEGDEESNHSWRPNMTFDGLYSDFFLSSPNSDHTNNSDVMKHSSKSPTSSGLDQMSLSSFPVRNFSIPFIPSSNNFPYRDQSTVSHDVLNILNFQRIQLNIMRYEILKSRTELDNLKEEVENCLGS
ncbi:uncharacterized protein LOC129217361 [Uloborus diversus]|uniref:uncharacterized protein LOC129217361 n=1 Tax=Uloborus diversus TaxID=327109 RepID=UPI0024093223|nr:uncharacterized protein LOC129217361 [Uloborus diversus]